MKKIDQLLISSFIPPFFVTFMIAMFVLVMQVLWLYIDDIAGKGLGFFIIMELLGYKCVSLVPMALPLAILISSVMVLGNMAERYELSSFKSAGVPLARIMRPMTYFALSAVAFSYYCSNTLIPVANLKFGSRMYDIQRQKPALRLDQGVFNDDFDNFAIHIGQKAGDDKTIQDVLIYDHSDAAKGQLSQIIAEEGEMYASDDGSFFVMNLKNGHQYIEVNPTSDGGNKYPFVRTNFKSWNKVFDLRQFELNRTNEDLFKSNRSMMSMAELQSTIDSLGLKIKQREINMANKLTNFFSFMDYDSTLLLIEEAEIAAAEKDTSLNTANALSDSVQANPVKDSISTPPSGLVVPPPAESSQELRKSLAKKGPTSPAGQADTSLLLNNTTPETKRKVFEGNPLPQKIDKPLTEYISILQTFDKSEHKRLFSKAQSEIRAVKTNAESDARSLDQIKENQVKHIYELNTKYTMAVVCLVFLFIGGPMGAIVRKGGFGYPILVSIIFFMLFIVLTIFCRKIAETFVVPAALAAWIPIIVLTPIGFVLTRKAMNDSKLLNADRYFAVFIKISQWLKRKKEQRDQQFSTP